MGLQSVIFLQLQQQLIQAVAHKTGMQLSTAQIMVPKPLLPVINLLNMGVSKTTSKSERVDEPNSLLSIFLESKCSRNNDSDSVIKLINHFLSTLI